MFEKLIGLLNRIAAIYAPQPEVLVVRYRSGGLVDNVRLTMALKHKKGR